MKARLIVLVLAAVCAAGAAGYGASRAAAQNPPQIPSVWYDIDGPKPVIG